MRIRLLSAFSLMVAFAMAGASTIWAKEREAMEVPVSFETLPEVVQKALKDHSDGGKIEAIQREEYDGKEVYEADMANAEKEWELRVDADGKLLNGTDEANDGDNVKKNETTIRNFDTEQTGALPPQWQAGVTGKGAPIWTVEADDSAPSKPNVLKQSGNGNYLWCVEKDVSLADGFVEVKFKPLSGDEDQAGGVVWRWKDGDNYYIARANALEGNITIYHTTQGKRRAFMNIQHTVAPNVWHTLRIDFRDDAFTVTFDGEVVITATDDTIDGPGAVGVWTKADSVTLFDNFVFQSLDAAPPVAGTPDRREESNP